MTCIYHKIENCPVCREADMADMRRELKVAESDTLAALRNERDTLKAENDRLTEKLKERTDTIYRADKLQEIWYWQGDGFDDLESITCPILIPADTLRNILNVGAETGLKNQAAEQARQEAVRELAIAEQVGAGKLFLLQSRLTKAEEALRQIRDLPLKIDPSSADNPVFYPNWTQAAHDIAASALQPGEPK